MIMITTTNPTEFTPLTGLHLDNNEGTSLEHPPLATADPYCGTHVTELEQTPPGPWSYNFFRFFQGLSAVVSVFMIIAQVAAWAILGSGFMQAVLRVYIFVFCIIFMSTEVQFESIVQFVPPFKNWIYRGFMYTFVALVGAAMSQAALATNLPVNPGFPEMVVSLILNISSTSMLIVGMLYVLMGILCMRQVWDRAEATHKDRVQARKVTNNKS